MILGIMGGMGPAATCDFYNKITELTHATTDQEHIHVIIDSNVQIPDRSKYICGTGENPKIDMIRSVIKLEMMGANYIVITCNTAHFFYDDIIPYTKVPIIHMIKEVASFLKKTYPNENKYLLLATEGTYIAGVYKNTFENYGLNIIEPVQNDKKVIMNWIYKVKSKEFDINPSEIENLIHRYIENGKAPVILGCTELPLLADRVGVPRIYIDPALILARCCVEIADRTK